MLKFLKIILGVLASLVALICIGVLAILIWPQLVINETTFKFASRIAANKGIRIQWKDLNIKIDSLALLHKKFGIKIDGLCVDYPEQGVSGCTSSLQLAFAGRLSSFTPQLTEIGPVEIRDLDWKLLQGKKEVKGTVNVRGQNDEEGSELKNLGKWEIKVWGDAFLPDRSHLKVETFLNLDDQSQDLKEGLKKINLGYRLSAVYQKMKSRASLRAEGSANSEQIKSRISAKATGWVSGLKTVTIQDCDLSLNKKEIKKLPGQFQIHCPIRVQTPDLPSEGPPVQLPSELGVLVQADLTTSTYPPSADSRVQGPIQLALRPLQNSYLHMKGHVKSTVDGVLADFPKRWKADTDLAIDLKIHPFEKLVKQFSESVWAVPAPLHVLRGNLEAHLLGKAVLDGTTEGRFPLHLTTRLRSKAQKLNLDGNGFFQISSKKGTLYPEADFNLVLSEVQLQLPRLNWAAPPRLMPDDRIRTPQPLIVESKPSILSDFKYRIAIANNPGHPIQILSNLAAATIPVNVNLVLADSSPIEGTIRVENFPVEVFRRKAKVKHFILDLKSPMKESPIDGAITVDYADYIMTVRIDSVIDKPLIKLTSDPPLPENQLVAALLFGRPLEELEPDQTQSVADARSAFADGAVGLASLYALASTPVQSVGYDSKTGIVSAKVRLGEGTSLNVGTGAGESSLLYTGPQSKDAPVVGVRKRLGGFWTIETDITNTGRNGGTAAAYLEWSHRY